MESDFLPAFGGVPAKLMVVLSHEECLEYRLAESWGVLTAQQSEAIEEALAALRSFGLEPGSSE